MVLIGYLELAALVSLICDQCVECSGSRGTLKTFPDKGFKLAGKQSVFSSRDTELKEVLGRLG